MWINMLTSATWRQEVRLTLYKNKGVSKGEQKAKTSPTVKPPRIVRIFFIPSLSKKISLKAEQFRNITRALNICAPLSYLSDTNTTPILNKKKAE